MLSSAVPDGGGPVTPTPSCSDTAVLDVFLSRFEFPALACADRLGLFRAVAAGAKDSNDIAERLKIGGDGAAALLGLMRALNLVEVNSGGYQLTVAARTYLLPESPFYWGPMIRMAWDSSCAALRDTLRDGRPRAYGDRSLWDGHDRAPGLAALFGSAMDAHATGPAVALADALDDEGATSLLDVGGGAGAFARALTAAKPDLHVAILERPAMCEAAAARLAGVPGADRIRLVPADMFSDEWPAEQDLVLFANVFHNWPRSHCRQLAANAYQALRPGGRILIHEILTDQPDVGRTAAAYAVAMVATTGGTQYAGTELIEMLATAGFIGCTQWPSFGKYWVVSGRKAGNR